VFCESEILWNLTSNLQGRKSVLQGVLIPNEYCVNLFCRLQACEGVTINVVIWQSSSVDRTVQQDEKIRCLNIPILTLKKTKFCIVNNSYWQICRARFWEGHPHLSRVGSLNLVLALLSLLQNVFTIYLCHAATDPFGFHPALQHAGCKKLSYCKT